MYMEYIYILDRDIAIGNMIKYFYPLSLGRLAYVVPSTLDKCYSNEMLPSIST